MIVRLALRSLGVRRLRTAVLAFGFGFGIAVMAELLGVGEVVLQQAHAPALQGGGDLVVSGAFGSVDSARFVLSNVLGAKDLAPRVSAAAPSTRALIYLLRPGHAAVPVIARGGVPSLERAVGDPEVANEPAWTDGPADRQWSHPDPGDVLRAMDRFHPIPDVPEFASSWAEWLYFNGRTADGRVRFYLTFLAGPVRSPGVRVAGVRLQLEHDGHMTSYVAGGDVDERALLDGAPDVTIDGNRVRLDGLTYRISLHLRDARESRASLDGDLALVASPGRSLPPAVIHAARGWVTGYVVPVLSGQVHGALHVGGETIPLEGAAGYHDHNWGFWKDVRWQWGQVAHGDLSFVYGRVFPPPSVADPERMPGFLGVLGPDGPLGMASDVSIVEHGAAAAPSAISVTARGPAVDLNVEFSVDRAEQTPFALTGGPDAGSVQFLQLGGTYTVRGKAGGRALDFSARGAAETFREARRPPPAVGRP